MPHFADEAISLIDENELEISEFPVYLPDLAPVENVFAYLKKVYDNL